MNFRLIVSLLMLSLLGWAADKPKAITEIDALRLENAQLKQQVIVLQFEAVKRQVEAEFSRLAAEQEKIRKEIFKKAKVDEKDYEMDLAGRQLKPKPQK